MKITTSKLHRKNQKVVIGGVTLNFDNDCNAEVTESEALLVVSKDASITILGENTSEDKTSGENESKADTKPNKPFVDALEKQHEQKASEVTEDTLSVMTIKELQKIAIDAKLPEQEWKKLNKTKLIAYIVEKTKE